MMTAKTKIQAKRRLRTAKRTFWGASVFYLVIAFEFFYMASPFAIYFYSAYRPVLNFFNETPLLAGLVGYFLPHFTETSSVLINLHNWVGGLLALLGFLAFCVGASQVYYYKLAKKGAVTSGIYQIIRHPQYTSLIISSFGMLLLWPRYIVLVMFIIMVFVYYWLAKAEELECEVKFGQSYIDYKNQTRMFIPMKLNSIFKSPFQPKSRHSHFLTGVFIFLLTLSVSIGIALGVNTIVLNSLYTVCNDDSVFIAITQLSNDTLDRITYIALSDEEVRSRINDAQNNSSIKMLNYVLPSEWHVPEIPMNGGGRHDTPRTYDKNLYKIVFTNVEVRSNSKGIGKEIIQDIVRRKPVLEVWVNLKDHKVLRILDMPENIMYEGVPVAIY